MVAAKGINLCWSHIFIWFKSISKVKCRFLSSFSLRDIHPLKILVVSTCEIAGDVMFHKLPLLL
jgi:hypothetical protein